jgi:drug/metabolite transporter (DMT)-like permease
MLPYLAVGVGVFCIGTSAIFVKLAGVPGTVSAFYRIFISAMALMPLFLLQRRRQALPQRRDMGWIGLGGFLFSMDLALWQTAILLTSAAASTLLANNAPIWVGLGAMVFFHERLSGKYWLGLATALVGMALIVGGNVSALRFNLGDLLSIAASMIYAGYMLVTQRARVTTDTVTFNTLTMLVALLILLPLNLISGQTLSGFSTETWLVLLGLGLIPQFIGWLAINYALGHLPAARVSVILLGQPLVTALLGVLLLGEALSTADILGGACVLGGIYLVIQRSSQSK